MPTRRLPRKGLRISVYDPVSRESVNLTAYTWMQGSAKNILAKIQRHLRSNGIDTTDINDRRHKRR